ncbi:antitoxin VbhA family protein [uncultured Holdemanella sp.]|jgi:hypothetical protein|uniref:antitoxin VbhA family protein n=1 Tax=uncultured Holdemanella sp. TaxID=1763549 RepID=UPI0025EEEE60|nr:antitoxin VbhA family protein [uncultured Holdemanella sp.]
MIIKNTEAGRIVQQVAATMAISDMYLSKEFIEKLLKVSNGEMTSEQLRKEVLKEYTQE